MAVYLRLPPGSRGRQCQLGSQSSPPRPAGANRAARGAGEPTAAALPGPGLFKSPNGSLPGFGGRWEM